MADRARVRQVELRPATRADLDVELHRLEAIRALAFRFVLLTPGEDHRGQADEKQHEADEEPDPERAALGLADDPGGESEGEGDEEVLKSHPAPNCAGSRFGPAAPPVRRSRPSCVPGVS